MPAIPVLTPPLPVPIQRSEVRRRLPPLDVQLDLVESAYRAMAAGTVELPPKIGVHPRPDAFLHAMPVYLRDHDAVTLKWVSGYPDNPSRGLPFISGVIVVNDAETGIPRAILDAAEITAARTAAASGVCIRAWAPEGWSRAAILGCGEQGRYHVDVLRHLLPAVAITGYDPVPERVARLGDDVHVATTAAEAARSADVVISAGPIVHDPESPLTPSWLHNRSWLLLPIDFDFYVSRAAVEAAEMFLTDDVAQFETYRAQGHFRDWPKPSGSVGEALADGSAGSRIIACNLGVATLDAVFAATVVNNP